MARGGGGGSSFKMTLRKLDTGNAFSSANRIYVCEYAASLFSFRVIFLLNFYYMV